MVIISVLAFSFLPLPCWLVGSTLLRCAASSVECLRIPYAQVAESTRLLPFIFAVHSSGDAECNFVLKKQRQMKAAATAVEEEQLELTRERHPFISGGTGFNYTFAVRCESRYYRRSLSIENSKPATWW